MGEPPSLPVAVTPLAPGTAPARGAGLLARAGWYGAVTAAAALLAVVGYRLDAHDLRVPLLYYDARGLESDSLLILPMVKSTIEQGHHWRCDRLGAPGVQEMHDFPVIDHFHFLWIWVLGRFTPDPGVVFNLYYLLGFPLAALTATAVFRHFRLSFPAAAAGGVLYAFLPYHLQRGQNHYFLSAYYVVPVTLMVILWVCGGRLPFFPADPTGRRRFRMTDRSTLIAILVAVVTASAGAYYAFFACALLVGAGLYGWAALRTWRAAASAGLVAAAITAGGVANHLPAVRYQAANGRNSAVTERFSEEAEYYGLKLAQLLLPIDDHSLQALAHLKSSYNSPDRPVQSWTERYTLGTVASAGLLFLLFRAVVPVARGWPYAPLTALAVFTLLVGTVGGFGAIFNHVVSPQVRCYNRVVVYLAFLCLFAVLHLGDRLARWLAARYPGRFWATRVAPVAGWVGLAWFGVWDQTPFYWGGPKMAERHALQRERFAQDVEFFGAVEDVLNPDRAPDARPMVFQLPYVRWPESPPVHQLWCYEHARGYLHTRTLRWSFGGMKWREVDEWHRRVIVLPVEPMLERVVKAGFEGLLLDTRGYTPGRARDVLADLNRVLGAGARRVAHSDGKQVFFDLRPYRDWVRQQYGGSWEAECRRELQPVTLLWLDGFHSVKEPGYEWHHRWCGTHGLAVFVNPTDETRTFRDDFHIRTTASDPTEVVIDGGAVWSETLTIDDKTPIQVREFVVPPGRHYVRFRCRPPASFIPSDARKLFFFIAGLKLE